MNCIELGVAAEGWKWGVCGVYEVSQSDDVKMMVIRCIMWKVGDRCLEIQKSKIHRRPSQYLHKHEST